MLLRHYDLARWCFTEQVLIAESVVPHSHPVLTLNTRHADPAFLLDQYLHEQLHWYASTRRDTMLAAIMECQHRYPDLQVAPPRGAGSVFSNGLHLILGILEYTALTEVLGDSEADRVLAWLTQDHYTAIYATVLRDVSELQELVERYHLMISDAAAGAPDSAFDTA